MKQKIFFFNVIYLTILFAKIIDRKDVCFGFM